MESTFVVTFDTDWCPLYMLKDTIQLLNKYEVKGTFFCTDIFDFAEHSNIEIAIHPNLMADSTQGSSEKEILENLQKRSQGVGVRTHRLFWYSDLAAIFSQHGILYDSSVFLPCVPYLRPFQLGKLTRFPVWWVDNMHLRRNFDLHRVDTITNFLHPGLKVLNFHPINIFFNHASGADQKARNEYVYTNKDITEDEARSLINPGNGLRTVFECFLSYIAQKQKKSWMLKDLLAIRERVNLRHLNTTRFS